MQDYDLTQYFF